MFCSAIGLDLFQCTNDTFNYLWVKPVNSFPQLMFQKDTLHHVVPWQRWWWCWYRIFNSTEELLSVKVLVAQMCPTLHDPRDCSPPGFSVHGILQARILKWVDIQFSRGSSQPRDRTRVSYIEGRSLTIWATTEAPRNYIKDFKWIISFHLCHVFISWNGNKATKVWSC